MTHPDTLTLTAGNVTITREADHRFQHTHYTTTVYRDGERVGFIQHGPCLWAKVVLEQDGERFGWGFDQLAYHWHGQPGMNCGQIPAALREQVVELVERMAEQVRAAMQADSEASTEAPVTFDVIAHEGSWSAGYADVAVLDAMPCAWADKAVALLNSKGTMGEQVRELRRIREALRARAA